MNSGRTVFSQLVPTGKSPEVRVAMVAGNTLLKFFFRQMLDQLREHGAARVHSALFHPARQPEKVDFLPFSIEIVLASTMRYHADLQWVRMAFRDFSRTVVTSITSMRQYPRFLCG